jgi:hypothetical protein
LTSGRLAHNDDTKTKFLFCKLLESTKTARDAFKKVSDFSEEHDTEWKTFVDFALPVLLLCWDADLGFKFDKNCSSK